MKTNAQFTSELVPEMQPRVKCFLDTAKRYGFDIRITDGYRTPAQQQALYEIGRVTPGKIVTNAKGLPTCQSNHCKRRAIDVVDRKSGYSINWEKLGKIGEACGLEWGGRWKSFPDRPHFQYLGNVDTPAPKEDNTLMPTSVEIKNYFKRWEGRLPTVAESKSYGTKKWNYLADKLLSSKEATIKAKDKVIAKQKALLDKLSKNPSAEEVKAIAKDMQINLEKAQVENQSLLDRIKGLFGG